MPAPALHELDPVARARIGEFTLRGLLTQISPDEKDSAGIPGFRPIQSHLEREVGMQLPDNLVKMLGLTPFNWKELYVDRHTLPLFYAGNNGWDFSLNEALATIEIAHRGYPTRIREGKVLENQREPILVRVAGLTSGDRDNRIVAVTYDAADGQVRSLNISLSDEEASAYLGRPVDSFFTPDRAIKMIPTRPDDPYKTAGFITAAMVDKTNSRHNTALTVFRHLYPLPNQPSVEFNDYTQEMTWEDNGFNVEERNRLVVVTAKLPNKSWQISVPAQLEKAAA